MFLTPTIPVSIVAYPGSIVLRFIELCQQVVPKHCFTMCRISNLVVGGHYVIGYFSQQVGATFIFTAPAQENERSKLSTARLKIMEGIGSSDDDISGSS